MEGFEKFKKDTYDLCILDVIPSTSMIPAFLRIRSMGVSIKDVRPELTFLMIQMIVYFLLACIGYKIAVIRQERQHRARIAAQQDDKAQLLIDEEA